MTTDHRRRFDPKYRREVLMSNDPSDAPTPTEDDVEEEDTPFGKIKTWLQYSEQFGPTNFDSHVRRNVKLLSAEIDPKDPTIARSTFLLTVAEDLCNGGGNLHGGCVALAFDMCTSLTVTPLVRENFWDTGHVSRTLNCTYLRPAPAGSEVLIESETVHMGKRLCHLKGTMRMKDTGKILYTCEHGKAAVGEPPIQQDSQEFGSEGELPTHAKAKL